MIPKIVHTSWKDKTIFQSDSPLIQEGIVNLIKLNPDWKVTIYDDEEVTEYLYESMDARDFKLIENDHIVAKTDIWRLIKLYREGGLYLDIDRYCNIKFDDHFSDEIKCVLPMCLDIGFSHDFMMSEIANPIYLETYKLLVQRRYETSHIYFLGPQTYMHGVTKVLMGQMIDVNPGIDTIQNIRETIQGIPFVYTYREDLPHDSVICRNKQGTYDEWKEQKQDLYHNYNLKHWTGDW
jgi:hypothetical protein